jgi:hypothetical protein
MRALPCRRPLYLPWRSLETQYRRVKRPSVAEYPPGREDREIQVHPESIVHWVMGCGTFQAASLPSCRARVQLLATQLERQPVSKPQLLH